MSGAVSATQWICCTPSRVGRCLDVEEERVAAASRLTGTGGAHPGTVMNSDWPRELSSSSQFRPVLAPTRVTTSVCGGRSGSGDLSSC